MQQRLVLWSGTSLSRVSSERGTPSVCLDARPNTKPKVTVVSMAWFEYLRGRPGVPARRPRRVPVGELAIGESEPDGQTPASAETRLVLPPIPDTGGRLDVLPLGARDTRHAGPRISGWRAIIDRDRELCTKACFRYQSMIGDRLRARSRGGRVAESVGACHVLNQMPELGRPESYSLGR